MHHTLYDKLWRDHLVDEAPDGTCLLCVDRIGGAKAAGR
jgi:hypothetical protein